MNEPEIQQKLTETFREVFDDDSIVLRPDLTAKDIDGWDSLTHVRLMLSIERTLGVHFPSHEITGLKTVGDLMRLAALKTAAAAK
jgi:acyl carrier protein